MNIAEKYYWITNHPKYVPFGEVAVIEIIPHMVCPETNRIEDLALLNTKLSFWVELMIPYKDEDNYHGFAHDWELDCGGDTWEEAVEALYQLVLEKYGDYGDVELEEHRQAWLEETKIKMPGYSAIYNKLMEDLNNFKAPGPDLSIPIVKLEDYEIESFKEDIEHIEVLLLALQAQLANPDLTMQDYSDIELQITCIDHDLEVAKLSLKYGYNVEVYGIRDENHEIDPHT